MYLKSIEIRGFKSFADRTELAFKDGVTAVVGPNGSGKSNISDAVRWVLGEQSIKSLRGGKMEDVIFAGTQFRKPVGLAQVSLTLDNSDYELPLEYSDVTISRRLYRSGESEYYINNTLCRLKDIHELFMDTGIGKEGYSIIGQGKIEAILSGKPEDRRNLLEEAAGIVKFKSRKEEAEKRLDNTEQNLVRINDILSTYEDRLEPLRIDNEKAKSFLELSEQLKGKEINHVLNSIDQIQGKLDSQSAGIQKFQEEVDMLNTEKNTNRDQLQLWNEKLEIHEHQSSEDKNKYYNLKNKHQNTVAEVNLLNERSNNLLAHIKKTTGELDEFKANIEALNLSKAQMEEELAAFQSEKSDIDNTIINLEKSIEELNSKLGGEEANVIRFREEEIELLRKISEAKNNSAVIQNNMEASVKKLEQMNIACESYLNSIKINTSTKLALESEINKINEWTSQNEEKIKDVKKEISNNTSKLSNAEYNLRQLTNEVNKLDANHNMLLNFEKQYEGYNKAVKSLMQHVDNGKIPGTANNCYVLGNIIKVDSSHEVAIEVALGAAISDVITYNEKTAQSLIKYLKDNNLGRATFLPLNILQSRPLSIASNIENAKGFIGIASKLVKYDDVFSKAIEYVVGRTIISENMDSALNIAKLSNYSFKIVTLSGEVVNPGGSLTGGSLYHKGSNIIGRKREIEQIEIRAKKAREEIENLNSNIEKIRSEIKNLDTKQLNLRDEIHFNHIEITKLEGKSAAIVSDSEKLKVNIKTAKDEILMLEGRIETYKKELAVKEAEISALVLREKENQANIEKAEGSLKDNEVQINEIKEKYLEYKVKKAQKDEIVSNRIKDLERISKELESSIRRCEEYKREIVDAEANMEAAKNKIQENLNIAEELIQSIEAIEKLFEDNEVIRIDLKDKIKKINERLDDLSVLLEKKEQERHRYEIVLAKQEAEKDTLYSKLNDELGLTYADADKFRSEVDDFDKLKSEIMMLKSRITALGVVNLGAIEEYEQTKEKYSFMSVQKEDLINAKNELMNVINEMTNKMKMVFNENFQKLRENFNETFKELFKGGSADLILADGDELTANIEINVMPPGKKLQNINLMSGGEKGLSAIALLFAILKMKPTPFCILDEIEAALDDANVFRYAEFLKKFSENIQFVVITHRKGTMEACDVLYGVTMEEKGVSKIVSVDLSS